MRETLAAANNPRFALSEGANVAIQWSSFSDWEQHMETYLAQQFNYGAGLVNIFAYGAADPALEKSDFTAKVSAAAEAEEAIRAYRKFLNGEALSELSEPGDIDYLK